MFFDPGCIPCIIGQAYNTSRLFPECNREGQLKIIKEVCAYVENIDENFSAPLFSSIMQSIIETNLDLDNPYKDIKKKNRTSAERYIPYLENIIDDSEDRLEVALKAAILGNTIDFAANPNFDIEKDLNQISSDNIALEMYEKFKSEFNNAKTILYIGDNYEEALFDKLLLRELKDKDVTFVTRSKPILNDITLHDAKVLGIDTICKVIESGSKIAGTVIEDCTNEFKELYNSSDLVISKGQGNYETLLDEERAIYFLFKVKCNVISERAGFPLGKGVLLLNKSSIEVK